MKITILGCGAAGGVPSLSRGWGNCDSSNPRNRRLRPSILIEEGNTRILVDTGADCREQLLTHNIKSLSAVLYTHEHADHLHGIDDLREINRAMNGPLPIYASRDVIDIIATRFPYVLGEVEEGHSIYKPMLVPNKMYDLVPFFVDDIDILPLDQDHGYTRSMGFRIGNFAYTTDVVEFPDSSFASLRGIRTWVVGCLTTNPHPTHAHLEKVLGWIKELQPERVFLTHLTPSLDYDMLCQALPEYIRPAYDGLSFDV